MNNLIYQVAIGEQSKLYEVCIDSVAQYCNRMGFTHYVLREPLMRIRPDMNRTGRSKEAVEKLGYLPIYEKENAFSKLTEYDNVAIIDADVYIKSSVTEDIFGQLGDAEFSAMIEASGPITKEHKIKLLRYGEMQYGKIKSAVSWSGGIAQFMNMGVMVMSNKNNMVKRGRLLPPSDFIHRPEFKDFVDGIGSYKWSTDQTLLNYWLYYDKIHTSNLDWKWNALYTAVDNEAIRNAYAIHFFLKDKLLHKGENIEEILKKLGE